MAEARAIFGGEEKESESMIKYLTLLITTMSAISLATTPDPINDYSVEQLYNYSSVVIDGSIVHLSGPTIEEQDSENIEITKYRLKPHALLINDEKTNIKRDSIIEFEYHVYNLDEPAFRLHIGDNIRLFLPRYIRDINERIVVTSKNQIHPELYGEGWKSDSPSLSAADILPRENEKPATPKWYWLTGGVVTILVFGGLTFLLGYLFGLRKSKV